MRFKKNRHGDERIVKKFLLFPCSTSKEIRWLEFARIRQRYDGHTLRFFRWYCIEFADKKKEE